MDADDLRSVITIFQRGYYEAVEAQKSAEAIAQLYRSKGHLFVKVSSRSDGSAPEVHRITFVITEGPSLKVRQVSFERSFGSARLGEVVTARPFPLLGAIGIGEGGYASFRQLELDVERLKSFYIGAGYPDAQVRCEVAPAPGRWQALGTEVGEDPAWATTDSLHVRFLIDEGPRVDIAAVEFVSTDAQPLPYQPAFFLESIDAKAGEPFRPEVIRNDIDRMQRLLGDAGYPQASADPDYRRDGTRVRLIWRLKLGPPLRVGGAGPCSAPASA
jgi:outer membrane protein assembly factor BamA